MNLFILALFVCVLIITSGCSNEKFAVSDSTQKPPIFEEFKNEQGTIVGYRYNDASENISTVIDTVKKDQDRVIINFTTTLKKPTDTQYFDLEKALLNDELFVYDFKLLTTSDEELPRRTMEIATRKSPEWYKNKQIEGSISFNEKLLPSDKTLILAINSFILLKENVEVIAPTKMPFKVD